MLALLYPICADIHCTSFPSSKQALIAEIFKFTDGCRGCSAVLTPRKPFGFCQGLSRFAIHVYNACFDGYPSRRMTSAMDCVASYIASAFPFCSLVYIIPSFPPVQDFVRRLLSFYQLCQFFLALLPRGSVDIFAIRFPFTRGENLPS